MPLNRDPLALEFGHRVLLQRVARRLSRAQLGQQLGVSARRIASIECGDHLPNLRTIVALHDALDLDWTALLDRLEGPSS